MIRADHLTRRFGGREVVRDVSFSVQDGEVVGFLGPNGAGKTTTIRLLLGLLRPHEGRASIDGPVGYLPEQFAGYDALSVRDELSFLAKVKGIAGARIDGEVTRVMGATSTTELARRPFGRLSKGQCQRVGLAQALLGDPAAYVLDEPTIGLDPSQVADARRLIRTLAAPTTDPPRTNPPRTGAAVLLSTHLLAEAAAVCDRVVVIVSGRVVAEERPGDAGELEDRFLRLVGEHQLR